MTAAVLKLSGKEREFIRESRVLGWGCPHERPAKESAPENEFATKLWVGGATEADGESVFLNFCLSFLLVSPHLHSASPHASAGNHHLTVPFVSASQSVLLILSCYRRAFPIVGT